MKHIAFVLIVTFLLFACTMTGEQYNQKLYKWVGQTEVSLLASWGKPTGQKQVSHDTKILTYTKKEEWYVPTEYYYDNLGWGADNIVYDPFFGEYEMMPYDQIVDTEIQEICQTSFVVTNGIITSYKWRGNNCF